MKILVTGGAGFIASHLVDKLIKEGFKVVIIDNLSTGKKENLNPKAMFYQIDIRTPKLGQLFKKENPKIVFHYAAQAEIQKSIKKPLKSAQINILGSLNVLENCRKNKVRKFIFASTGGAIYGEANQIPTPENYPARPLSPYGIEKLTIENYLNYYYNKFSLPFISLRLGNVYGPRQNPKGESGVISIFCEKMISGKQPIINGNGRQTRDFVYIDDVVKANILAMRSKKIGIFNIGTGKETDINTIFRKVKKLTGSNCKEIHGPEKKGEQKRSCLDYSKAKKELGWQPKYNIEDGLKKTIKWFISQNYYQN